MLASPLMSGRTVGPLPHKCVCSTQTCHVLCATVSATGILRHDPGLDELPAPWRTERTQEPRAVDHGRAQTQSQRGASKAKQGK